MQRTRVTALWMGLAEHRNWGPDHDLDKDSPLPLSNITPQPPPSEPLYTAIQWPSCSPKPNILSFVPQPIPHRNAVFPPLHLGCARCYGHRKFHSRCLYRAAKHPKQGPSGDLQLSHQLDSRHYSSTYALLYLPSGLTRLTAERNP